MTSSVGLRTLSPTSLDDVVQLCTHAPPLQRCGLRSIEGVCTTAHTSCLPPYYNRGGLEQTVLPVVGLESTHMFEWRTVPVGSLLCTLAPSVWLILVPGAIAGQEFGWMFAALVLVYAAAAVRKAPTASSMPARSQRHLSTRRPPPTSSCLGSCSDNG